MPGNYDQMSMKPRDKKRQVRFKEQQEGKVSACYSLCTRMPEMEFNTHSSLTVSKLL